MGVRIPNDASQNVQNAFRDVEQEISTLKARSSVSTPDVGSGVDLSALISRIEQLEKRPRLNSDKDVFVGSGAQHSPGLVPDPQNTQDTEQVLNEQGWGYPARGAVRAVTLDDGQIGDQLRYASYITDVNGALHVAGPMTAGEVSTKDLYVYGDANFPLREPLNTVHFREDFTSGSSATANTIGEYGWSAGGTGATVAAGTSTPGHPGIENFTTGTTVDAVGYLYHHASNYVFPLGDILIAGWVAYFSLMTGALRCILSPSVSVEASNGDVGFERINGDSNWYSITRNASGITRKDTGIAASATTWYNFEARKRGPAWDFYINGVLKTTHTGSAENVPADTVLTQIILQTKSDGNSVTCSMDLFEVYGFASRR